MKMVLYFPKYESAKKAPSTGARKVVPFHVSTFAAFEAVLPCRTLARYTTKFREIPANAILSKNSNPT